MLIARAAALWALGSSLEQANLYRCASYAFFFFFFNLRTMLFFLIHSPVSSVSPAPPIPRLLHRPFFPQGAPHRDLNLEYPKAFPSTPYSCLFFVCLFGFPLSPPNFENWTLFPPDLSTSCVVSETSVISESGELVKITASLEAGETEVTQLVSDKVMRLGFTA